MKSYILTIIIIIKSSLLFSLTWPVQSINVVAGYGSYERQIYGLANTINSARFSLITFINFK
jgi:hypothetical protein